MRLQSGQYGRRLQRHWAALKIIERFRGASAPHLVDEALEHTHRERDGIPTLLERAGLTALERARAFAMLARVAGLGSAPNDHTNPAARRELAVEAAAMQPTPMVYRLTRLSGLNDLVQSPEVQKAAKTCAAWRELAEIVGRPDLIGQRGDIHARELAAAALAYNGPQNVTALLQSAGLGNMRWDKAVRTRADEMRAEQRTVQLGKRKRDVSLAI